ncbi:MAG TPA: plastocyanin/azurin family copper-binding protein [Solirubrobacteraceae bacterium]|jgi:plastocyanin
MIRGLSAVIAAAALALAAGCGSSSGTTSTSAETTSTAAATSSAKSSAKSAKGGVHVNTTPKYASPAASAPVQSGVVQIAYRNIAIDPDTLKVKVGSTLKWTNYDTVEHNVTSKGGPSQFASKNFGEGGTFEFKTTKAGTIHYVCTIHPATMNGTIEVTS